MATTKLTRLEGRQGGPHGPATCEPHLEGEGQCRPNARGMEAEWVPGLRGRVHGRGGGQAVISGSAPSCGRWEAFS